MLPEAFIKKLENQHPEKSASIIDALQSSDSKTSIRYNKKKAILTGASKAVPWCAHGFYLDERPQFTLDPKFHAGEYYVQEASSMFLFHILNNLSLPKNPHVLDLCAAPGGKSTLILDYLEGRGLLVANEVIKSRANILQENVMKWGYNNCCVTSNDPKDFTKIHSYFDVVIVDAPCSGEGMFRKDIKARDEWSEDNVHLCEVRQQRIVADVADCVKTGGYLIYSTCTFNHEENIDNVQYFCNNFGFESISIPLEEDWNVYEIKKENSMGYHFFPGSTNGEGLFISVLKEVENENSYLPNKIKKPKLLPLNKSQMELMMPFINDTNAKYAIHENGNVYCYNDDLQNNIEQLLDLLSVKYSGVLIGNIQKNLFLPDHALAMSSLVNPAIQTIELTKSDALKYLHRTLNTIESPHKSWMLATFEGLKLGWLKNLGNRINNYYPTEWRIRMDVV